LVKTNGLPCWNEPAIGWITNWCIGSILPSAANLTSLFVFARSWPPGLALGSV
jgi:hypothetical protein